MRIDQHRTERPLDTRLEVAFRTSLVKVPQRDHQVLGGDGSAVGLAQQIAQDAFRAGFLVGLSLGATAEDPPPAFRLARPRRVERHRPVERPYDRDFVNRRSQSGMAVVIEVHVERLSSRLQQGG